MALLFSADVVCYCSYSVASFVQCISGKMLAFWRESRSTRGLGNVTCRGELKELDGLGQKRTTEGDAVIILSYINSSEMKMGKVCSPVLS